ncbi:MAG: AzlD domain-containing protein [Archaeoglobus sp.]|uniref:AzlD domain-containing protein n=1 Tax=Archaeoglobus sp. TaxID=1872626 RepID=UPI001D76949B|nr:AzlD domain-containing protein [Archaeoglobus sp.]
MNEKVVAIVAVAIGTYLSRFLPLKFKFSTSKRMKNFLSLSSTSAISALFVTSIFTTNAGEMGLRVLALIPLILTFNRWKNFGISIIAAIISYYLLRLAV